MYINNNSSEYSSNDIRSMAFQLSYEERGSIWDDHDEFDPEPNALDAFAALYEEVDEYGEEFGVDPLAEESDFGLDIDSAGLQNPSPRN